MRWDSDSRAGRWWIVLVTSLAVVLIGGSVSAQSMRLTYDASGNVVQRSSQIGELPQILRQPQVNIVAPGGIASFSVIVSDTRNASYQWRFNGANISGATSDTLLIPNVGSANEGQYSVLVTNDFGNVTSDPAALVIDTNANGLPDSWEVANFGGLSTQRAGGDADADGSSNLVEFFDGTNPTASGSFRPRLSISADGGTVTATPAGTSYALGEQVTLTATPGVSTPFYGWSGDASGKANPITVVMNGNRSVVAHFRCAPIPTGAVAYWRAETDASDAIADHLGQFFNGGTVVPPRLTSAGLLGSAFDFDGSVHVRVPDDVALRPAKLTIESWVYPRVTNSSWQAILCRGSSANNDNAYCFALNSGKPQFYTVHGQAGQQHLLQGLSDLPLNQWSHLAGTFDGDRKSFFVNGSLVATVTGLSALFYDSGAVPVTIGADWDVGSIAVPFIGRVDEAAIYSRALTPAEVAQTASAGSAGKCSAPYFATPAPLPDGVLGAPYVQALSVVLASPPVAISLSGGSLPPGLVLSTAGAFTGTPSASGEFRFALRALDNSGASTEKAYTIAIRAPLPPEGPRFVTSAGLPAGAVGQFYSQAIVADGGAGPLSYWINGGTVPPGLTLAENGSLTGTPSEAGTFQFTVAVMDTSLASEQIYTLHVVEPLPPPAGLVGWWRGESDASDSAGPHDGTFYGGTIPVASTLATGFVGGAMSFDGSMAVHIPDSSELRPSKLSLEAWIYPTARTLLAQEIIARAFSTDNLETYGFGLVNGVPNFWTRHIGAGQHQLSAGGEPLPLNAWNHLAATFDGFTKRLYINGELVASVGGFDALLYDTAAVPLTIGGYWTPSGSVARYIGHLDEVSLYNRALTVVEVADIFGASFAGKRTAGPRFSVDPSLRDGTVGGGYGNLPLIAPGGPAPVSARVTGGALPPGLALGADGVISGTPTTAGNYWWEITATDASGVASTATFTVGVSAGIAVPLGSRGWWCAEANALDSAGDSHGTLVNGASFATGKVGQGFSLDGVDDRVSISENSATDLSRMTAWTIDAWVFPISFTAKSFATIYSEGPRAASLGLNTNTGKLESWLNNTNRLVSDTALELGAWNHVALTYDATGRTFYIDGAVAGRGQGVPVTPDNQGAAIGDVTNNPNSSQFTGTIDEVTIYGRALPAYEVGNIYRAGSAGKVGSSEAASHFRAGQTLPDAVTGQSYSEDITSSGAPPSLVYDIAGGAIPPGVALTSNGVLSGVPTNPGDYAFLVRATDPSATVSDKLFSLRVLLAPLPASAASAGMSEVP